jgi:hypothetical protein
VKRREESQGERNSKLKRAEKSIDSVRFQVACVSRDIIDIAQEVKSKVVGKPFAVTICMTLANKGLQNRFKWKDKFCLQKGVEHALDHLCDSLHFVVVRISGWLFGWWTHSSPAGRCHHRRGDPSYSGTKVIVAIWTLAGEGEVFGEEVVSRSGKILPKRRIASVDKIS